MPQSLRSIAASRSGPTADVAARGWSARLQPQPERNVSRNFLEVAFERGIELHQRCLGELSHAPRTLRRPIDQHVLRHCRIVSGHAIEDTSEGDLCIRTADLTTDNQLTSSAERTGIDKNDLEVLRRRFSS